jgi:DNA-binding transcriptional LysR family regulator
MVDLERFNGDDVRMCLTTMRAASLRQAASDLGVSRPTADGRLTALEVRLGLNLFDRRPEGLPATAEAVELMGVAEDA